MPTNESVDIAVTASNASADEVTASEASSKHLLRSHLTTKSSNPPATTSTVVDLPVSATVPVVSNISLASQPVSGGGYTASNGQIYDASGQRVVLRGVNWFGFEGGGHVAHGLWGRNWHSMLTQIKSTGFNAVRLPICPASLHGASIGQGLVDYSQNADLQGLNSQQVMDKVVNEMNRLGLYVLIDMHTPDCDKITELWHTPSYPESAWVPDLQGLAERYAALPYFIGLDLKNEPHGSATWGTGNASTDWNSAAERAGSAVLSKNSRLLVFIEGIQDSATCSSSTPHFAGINFEPINCTPLKLPANKIVYSPHIYGPDVWLQSYFADPSFPSNMPKIWTTQFGFLKDQGMTVVPGEWGGKYGTGGGLAQDVTLQDALIKYYASKGICSSFYWSWNPNSGDTGGILKDDWQSVWSAKVALLQTYWNSCH